MRARGTRRPCVAVALLAAACVAVALLAGGAEARHRKLGPRTLTFAGVPWGTPAESLTARLAASGFKAMKGRSPDNQLVCGGRLFERFAHLEARVDDQGRLVRITIVIEPKPGPMSHETYADMRPVYDEAVQSLTAKRGEPDEQAEHFTFPYAGHDRIGDEDMALDQGHADIHAAWTALDRTQLRIEMTRSIEVQLQWTSAAWAGYDRRTRANHAKNL